MRARAFSQQQALPNRHHVHRYKGCFGNHDHLNTLHFSTHSVSSNLFSVLLCVWFLGLFRLSAPAWRCRSPPTSASSTTTFELRANARTSWRQGFIAQHSLAPVRALLSKLAMLVMMTAIQLSRTAVTTCLKASSTFKASTPRSPTWTLTVS